MNGDECVPRGMGKSPKRRDRRDRGDTRTLYRERRNGGGGTTRCLLT
jgi:hypothetical protein